MIDKFRKLAARRIPNAQIERIVTAVMEAEKLPSAAALAHTL